MGYVFSIYCVLKIILSSYNVLFHSRNQTDAVTNVLHILQDKAGWSKFDIDFWATNLSFLIIGGMSLSSIRAIIIQFAKVNEKS